MVTIATPRRLADDRIPVGLATAAVASAAGLLLVGWPAGAHAHHDLRLAIEPFVLYLAMWLTMVVAMMLPTAIPLLNATWRVAGGTSAPRRVLGHVVLGYLGVWLLAGAAARAVELIARRGVDSLAGASANSMPGMVMPGAPGPRAFHIAGIANAHVVPPAHSVVATFIAAGVLGLAGLHQLSPLASRCLHACRSPVGFFARRWDPGRTAPAAISIGWAYGVSCVGCCAGLMVVLVLVGMQSIAWMAALGILMAAEKNLRFGRPIAYAAGGLMLATAAALACSAAIAPAG